VSEICKSSIIQYSEEEEKERNEKEKERKKKVASRSPCLRASQNSIPKPKQIRHV
jgi:hypothetical protein